MGRYCAIKKAATEETRDRSPALSRFHTSGRIDDMQPSAGHGHDWSSIAVWALVGLAAPLVVIAAPSFGLFLVPVVVVLLVVAVWRRPIPSLGGLALGVGIAVALPGILGIDELWCPDGGQRVLDGGRVIESCGSFDPLPWLIVGGLLCVAAAVIERVRPTT